MKNINLRFFLTSINIILANILFSQCPISFPKSVDVCLEGITSDKNICFKNNDGNLNLLFNSTGLFSFYKNGNFEIGGDTTDDRKLVILGANTKNTPSGSSYTPTHKRDISYEFKDAGSAKIRAFRGDRWDTYIQFLTNRRYQNNDNPQVSMQINENGNVGIGTTDPKELLDVNGNAKFCSISENDYKLIIEGANTRNYPYGKSNFISSFKRDISYEFKYAGSAKIRAFRGDNWDTYIQFLTNRRYQNNDNPQVSMQINENGNVGIGTTDPKELLDVNGNVSVSGLFLKLTTPVMHRDAIIQRATQGNLIINSGQTFSSGEETSIYLNYAQEFGAGKNGVKIYDGGTDNYVDLKMIKTNLPNSGTSLNGTFLISPSGGRVVISDKYNIPATPYGYKLYVTEGILSEKFKAAISSTSQWSDHVFGEDYKLKTLDEVEQFIKANKHLPNIPSSEEIIRDGGVDLAQMQAKQMEKIEELTLYLIEMKKEIEDLRKQNEEYKQKLKKSKNEK